MSRRTLPNILVCGTPGTGEKNRFYKKGKLVHLTKKTKNLTLIGKSTLAEQICQRVSELQLVDVNEIVKAKALHDGLDQEWNSLIVDEDKLVDELDDSLSADSGGVVVDYHGCDFFPERWFDMVVVLRTDNTVLYDRLAARGYAENKLTENIDAEILQVVLDLARESYRPEIVFELTSNSVDDLDNNTRQIVDMVAAWVQQSQQQ
jgi:adenylate kinase